MGAAPDRAEELFHEHSRRIYAYCLRQLGSPEEAEDALQATYLNACRSLLSGFEPEVAQAWLFKVAHNVCLTRRRSSWRRSRVERPQDIQSIEEFIAAPEEQGEQLLGIEDALAGLPDQQRRAILLREWHGLSYREVATELGLSQSAVETLLFRARRSLAAALEEPEVEPERRARFLGGALLAGLKSSLAGSLGSGLAAGLALTASTTLIAATPLSNVRALERPTAQAAEAAPERTTTRTAPADHDRASAEHLAAARSAGTGARGNGHAYGHSRAKQHKPDHAGQAEKRHTKVKGGKPSSAGDSGPAAHASSGGGSSNAGGNGKSQSAPKRST